MEYNWYTCEIIWPSLRYCSVYYKLGVYRATSLVHALNRIFWSMMWKMGSECHKQNSLCHEKGLKGLCFSKSTDSFMCFEELPVPPKVWCQNGTLWKEWLEHSDRFHSLSAKLNSTLLKFLKFILQSSMHFQLQNNLSKKRVWLYVLHHMRKRAWLLPG